ITGIFDMAGNAGEYTMGNFDNTNKGGFSNLPEGKYYDVYTSATCTVAMCGGHALNETAGWYGDTIEFVTSSNPWFLRGGTYQDKEATGIFFYQAKDGTASLFRGTKAVMAVFAPDTEKASSITGVPSVSVKYTSNDNAYTSGTWTNENIYVSLSITSQDIGVSKFQYSTNGGTRWNDLTCTKSNGVQVSNNIYTCQENWTTNGSNTLIFRAVDASSGYTNASTLVNIKYDNEGPTGSIDTLLSGTVLTATANASDPSSGVVNQYYFKVLTTDTCGVGTEGTTNFIDNEDSNVYSFSVEQETTYYICARVSDNVGNIAYISETRYVSNKAYLKVLSDDLDFKESTYANKINKLDIVNYIDLSESVANFNLTNDGTNTITAWLINNTQNASNYDLYIGSDYKIYATNLSHAFTNLSYVKNVNIDALFTDEATDMSWMFWNFGKYANITDWSLNLGNNFNTSKVTNMNGMFGLFCEYSSNCSINLGNHFNTINVTDMSWMFRYSGISDSNLKLGDHFNTSNVTNMSEMFYGIHGATDTFNLNLGNHFNTIKVKDMSWMFAYTGYSVVNWNLNFGNYFNTSNVTDMQSMFRNAGYNAANFSLLLDNNFNTSKVKNMSHLFVDAGYNATNWSLNLGNKFITTNVTDMSGMFAQIGGESTNFSLLLDNNFNTSKVTDMAAMFAGIGRNAIDLDLNLGNHFDTSNVTDMAYMFSNFGLETTNWYLNLGNKFNTSNVTNMLGMFDCAGINSVNFNFYLGNNFDANKASFKISMFRNVGRNATNFNLDLGNKFGTIRYANNMFMNAGQNATNFNLSLGNNFNMSNVSYGENLFFNAGYSTTTPFILDLSGGNIKVDIFTTGPGYKGMFNGFGNNMATIYVKDATAQNWIISKNSYWGTNFSASNVLIK
ncbi:MAG: BspA family leucine-rich repeat surface protein, partial [Bacilli bacterium]|nr:BspA family leucine-rich repeat surface protein [Bacilli bacterium]